MGANWARAHNPDVVTRLRRAAVIDYVAGRLVD
jgi:hypothetical protein